MKDEAKRLFRLSMDGETAEILRAIAAEIEAGRATEERLSTRAERGLFVLELVVKVTP